jgi:hypothetical protein
MANSKTQNFWQKLTLQGKITLIAFALLVVTGVGVLTWSILTGRIRFFAEEAPNQVYNGNFETGLKIGDQLTAYEKSGWQLVSGKASIVSAQGYSFPQYLGGANMLRLEPGSKVVSRKITLAALSKNRLTAHYYTFCAQTPCAQTEGSIGVEQYFEPTWYSNTDSLNVTTGDDKKFKSFSKDFEVNYSDPRYLTFRVVVSSGRYPVFVDNFSLTKIGITGFAQTQTQIIRETQTQAARETQTAAVPISLETFNSIGGKFDNCPNVSCWEPKNASDAHYGAIVKLGAGNAFHVDLGYITTLELSKKSTFPLNIIFADSHEIGGSAGGIVPGREYQLFAKLSPFNPSYQNGQPANIVVEVLTKSLAPIEKAKIIFPFVLGPDQSLFSERFIMPQDVTSVRIRLRAENVPVLSGEVYLDDIQLEDVTDKPTFTPTFTSTVKPAIVTFSLEPAAGNFKTYEIIPVKVKIDTKEAVKLTDVKISYPKDLLDITADDIQKGDFEIGGKSVDKGIGTVVFSTTGDSFTGTKTLALVNFKAKAKGTAELFLSGSKAISTQNVIIADTTFVSAKYEIIEGPTPTFTLTFTPSNTPTFTNTPTPTNTPKGGEELKGDVDGNGVINYVDLQLAINLAGNACSSFAQEPQKGQCRRGDTNASGSVDREDLSYILAHIAR